MIDSSANILIKASSLVYAKRTFPRSASLLVFPLVKCIVAHHARRLSQADSHRVGSTVVTAGANNQPHCAPTIYDAGHALTRGEEVLARPLFCPLASTERLMLARIYQPVVGVPPSRNPPSTVKHWPVIKEARSDTRKAAASAISSGRPIRRSGVTGITGAA